MAGPDPPAAISAALEQILARYRAAVTQTAGRHGLAGADLDDLLQEVRIRLWRALGTAERISVASTSYVYRTATTAALDLIRRRRARQYDSIEGGEVAESLLSSSRPAPVSAVESKELVGTIGASVAALAPGRRQVVRMYLAGYGRDEICALLGWSEAKTRNLLYRGLSDLREQLTAKGITPELAQ